VAARPEPPTLAVALGNPPRLFRFAYDDLSDCLQTLRDRIFDVWALDGVESIPEDLIRLAALPLLLVHHPELSVPEAQRLIADTAADVLGLVVRTCLFGPDYRPRTYSAWARSALLANGLSPRMDALDRPAVLWQLVQTGRAVPPERAIDSLIASQEWETD
jgi:hypothetical protein